MTLAPDSSADSFVLPAIRPSRGPGIRPAMSAYERWSPVYTMIIFIVMSLAIESFLSRQTSPDLLGRMSFVFTIGTLSVCVITALILRPKALLHAFYGNIPFQLYSLTALFSTMWSYEPSSTLKASAALIAFHGIGTCMAALFSWRAIWLGLAWALLVLALLGVLSIPFDGLMTEIHPGAFRGLWIEKNASGAALALGTLACIIVSILDRNPKYLLGAGLLLGLIVFARSATSLMAVAGSCTAVLGIEAIRRGPARFFGGLWLAVIAAVGISMILIFMGPHIAELVGRDVTFTGRAEIWPPVLRAIEARPWLGYGFEAFWVDGSDTKLQVFLDAKFEAQNAHNTLFELMLAFGLVGTSIILFSIIRAFFQSSTALYGSNGARRTFIPYILMACIMSATESSMGNVAGLVPFMLGILVPKVALGALNARRKTIRH